MKVHESYGLIANQIQKKKEVKEQGEKPFSSFLDEIGLERGVQESETSLPGSGILPEGVLIIDRTMAEQSGSGVEKATILRDLEQTLDLISFYASKLADRSFSVQDMDSLVSHLEERLEGLQTLEKEPGIPGKLKDIVSDTILTLGRETAKFRRGDYT